jgi:hypothetical protein
VTESEYEMRLRFRATYEEAEQLRRAVEELLNDSFLFAIAIAWAENKAGKPDPFDPQAEVDMKC